MSPSVSARLLATQSDARLVELARSGHERAFDALVQRYRRPLLGHCRRMLLPEARAEDTLQQALLQAWLALQRGDEVRHARAWLYRILHNTALNALRSSGYDHAELSEAITGAGAPHEDLDRRIAVREALAGLAALPEQQREALLRTAVEGASHAAAAAEMGVSEGALRGLVHRARATLRAGLTAITPMPLATWAADAAAGHGAGAVAELTVGGGSAAIAGVLAKGGTLLVTAGVVAAGVGGVAATRHTRLHVRPHPVRAARAAATVPPARAVAAAGGASPVSPAHAGRREHRHSRPVAFLRPRDGRHAGGGGGETPSQGTSGGGDDGRGRRPGSGSSPAPGTGGDGPGDGGSGDGSGGHGDGAGDGGHRGASADSRGDGGPATRGDDGASRSDADSTPSDG
ncbi:MAG TPA: sigma-70 family RNA polymerase sigma factor [Conexibacter sp.]|nr:sigma-70 family RNA polymerase sigma factor [Conexibacter sp.]